MLIACPSDILRKNLKVSVYAKMAKFVVYHGIRTMILALQPCPKNIGKIAQVKKKLRPQAKR